VHPPTSTTGPTRCVDTGQPLPNGRKARS
jgi:hypothetical protein